MVSSPVAEVEAEEHEQLSTAADATAIPSHYEPQHDDHKQQDINNQDPNPTELPPPHFETLDPPNPNQSDDKQLVDNNALTILVEEDQRQPPPPPVTSPRPRQNSKRKKGNSLKRKYSMKKMKILNDILNPIPFRPTIALDFVKHEDVLKRLMLYEFSKIEFDRTLRKDYVVQLIVNYDAKKRCSFVNDLRVPVNRTDLARALKLPVTKIDKGTNNVDEVDLDSEVFSDKAIGFIEDFVMNWMLLPEMPLVMPTEIVNWTRCIRDGHPEKMDSASLIWYKVERELAQGDKLTDCYYASHLQYLIKAFRPELFVDNGGDVVADECEEITKVDDLVDNNCEEITKIDDGVDNDCEEIMKIDDEKEEKEEKDEKEDKEEKVEKGENDEKDENLGKVSIVEEYDIELTLRPDVEESIHEEVKKDDDMMVDAEELKAVEEEVEEHGNWALGGKNILGDHYLQRCQNSDLNSYEERQVEEVQDERMEQLDCEDAEEEEQEEEGERLDEGFDMEANDSMDRDGLADNYLQGMETSHIPYNNSHGMSSMDLFGSRDETFMSHGGPSFFNNGGKRVMEPDEEDVHHLDGNNKRLKTDEMWDQKSSDLGYCFEQMQQWMEKAKMVHESKEQSYENSQYSQQYEINQLQGRQNLLEDIIKSKDEELQKKHTEVFRLEHELYLMGDLVKGYRKALNDTRFKFSEYRKCNVLQEEPLYKDAGPGGLVLSTRELEKQRLKQEEDKMKFMMIAKNLEDEFVYVLKMHDDRVLMMGAKLMSIENEVKMLRESSLRRKETQKGQDEQELLAELKDNQKLMDQQELSAEPEENQKSVDEHELTSELEDHQKSVDEHELTAELEDNQKSVDEHELTAELEDNQKSVDEHKFTVELEDNQKTMEDQESSAELEETQKTQDEVLVNNATIEYVPLDVDESKEKGDGKDCTEEECS